MNPTSWLRRSLTPVIAIIAAAIAFLALSPDQSAQASGNYNPTFTIDYCNSLPAGFGFGLGGTGPADCTDVRTTSTAQTTTTNFNIPFGDMNFSSLIAFYPSATTFADGSAMAAGDLVGGLTSQATLGLANGRCNTGVPVKFILYNVALPSNLADPRASSNIYVPLAEGTGNSDVAKGRYSNGVTDGNGDNMADSTSVAFSKYPDWFLDLFDPDWNPINPPINGADADPGVLNTNNGPLKPVVPRAVYGAMTIPEGTTDWVPYYIAQFDDAGARALTGKWSAPHPWGHITSGLGKPNVSILTDTTVAVAAPNIITDFCSPLAVQTMTLGVSATGAVTRVTTPATSGSYQQLIYTASGRDIDNDTYENGMDTCPKVANVDGDPRTTAGPDTPSGDMIDSACDSTPGVNTGFGDPDADGFLNAQDNCPVNANGKPSVNPAWDGQRDNERAGAYPADGGPWTDGVGDACDSGSWTGTQNGTAGTTVTLSSSVANGNWISRGYVRGVCFGNTVAARIDVDGDGWCATSLPADSDDTSAAAHPAIVETAVDMDGDGWSVWQETVMGTDDTKSCSFNGSWPLDFDDTGQVDISDVNSLAPPAFFSVPPSGSYNTRLDVSVSDGLMQIDISDVNMLAPPVFFSFCTPVGQQ